jgi:hypothetical protein
MLVAEATGMNAIATRISAKNERTNLLLHGIVYSFTRAAEGIRG